MINNISQKQPNITFKATIHCDRKLVLETLSKDKKLTDKDFSAVSKLLDKIDSFSKMKEDSIVEVSAKVDSWQTKILCNVYDSTKKIFKPVLQRTVSLLSKDKNYRKQHLKNTKALIKNVAVTRKSIDMITESSLGLKNSRFNEKNLLECFESPKFTKSFINSLEKGYNPTKRIVKLLKAINKSADAQVQINLSTETTKNKNKSLTSFFVVSFKNGEKREEKRILLSELFKKPIEDRLIQK